VSYFLTGEHRGYKKSGGRFTWAEVKKSLDPANGGWGAWQLAARYSGIDLRDSGLNGGVEKNVTVGINWHPFSNTRLMLNYVWADVDDSGDEDRSSFGITNASGHAHIIQARAQLEF
jgi:phosphate-selective porin OprO/OprP